MACLSEEEWLPENNYTLEQLNSFPSRKWKTVNSNYEIKLKPLPNEEWQDKMFQIFESVLKKVIEKAKPGCMARLVIFIDGTA